MMHIRRHLLDELNWIHPLSAGDRPEPPRHSSEQIQDYSGAPHDWDEAHNRRGSGETGVDTANFIEALVSAWEESGDRFFLDRARGYTRWTLRKWRARPLTTASGIGT